MRIAALPTVALLAAGALLTPMLAACSGSDKAGASTTTAGVTAKGGGAGELTIYSGRSEKLVKPLIDQLAQATGAKINVRYGDSSELAAQIIEEGAKTPADLFFSQDAGALGALAAKDRLTTLPAQTTAAVPAEFKDPQSRWVATSVRERVVAYNPTSAPEAAQLAGIDAILNDSYKGKIGIAPTNASFQSFVTALRASRGEAAAEQWLTKLKSLEPKKFDKNTGILDAVNSGTISLGLINHYYWHAKAAEVGGPDKMTAKLSTLPAGDPGALLNVAGVGIIGGSDQSDAAQKAIAHLLTPASQSYFANETAEFPVIAGVTSTKHALKPLTPGAVKTDLNSLADLPGTTALLTKVGLL